MVYDKANRLMFSQDDNQRTFSPGKSTVFKYDDFGRLLYSAEFQQSLASFTDLNEYFKDIVVTESYSTTTPQNPLGDTGYTKASSPVPAPICSMARDNTLLRPCITIIGGR
jgi:hypothetical protein